MNKTGPRAPDHTGIGPTALGHLLRDRSLRLAAGLAIVVAIPVAILFYFQFRSLSDLGQSSAVVLRQLSQETADGTTKQIADALKSPYINVLLRITQQQTEPLNLPFIENAFARSLEADAFVSRFYVWSDVTEEYRNEVLAYDRERPGFRTGVPEGPMLLRRIRELARDTRAITAFE